MPKPTATAPLARPQTRPLPANDLGLLATAVVVRGRRLLEGRAPWALKYLERAASAPAVRQASVALERAIGRAVLVVSGLRGRMESQVAGLVATAVPAGRRQLTASLTLARTALDTQKKRLFGGKG